MEQVVEKIIHVFVDALPHVPEHRQLPIMLQLLEVVGAGRFLWVLLVLFFEQHVSNTVEKSGDKVSSEHFLIQSISCFHFINE